MIKYSNRLTWALYNDLAGRKKQGDIHFFYDIKNKGFIPIPKDVEHVEFASRILDLKNPNEIISKPNLASHLIPLVILVKENQIVGVYVGYSGMEIGYGVRHEKRDLDKAYGATIVFIESGEVPINKKGFESYIEYKFARRKVAV